MSFNIENKCLKLDGELTRFSVADIYQQIIKNNKIEFNSINLKNVTKIDSAGVAFLNLLKSKFTVTSDFIGVTKTISDAIETFTIHKEQPVESLTVKDNFFIRIGEKFVTTFHHFMDGLYLTADVVFWSFVSIFNRSGQRKGAVIQQSIMIGADAVGIISLISIILGLILSIQSAAQLRQFGASIYVADLLAISMTREMGPMMTAIIVAGRSGSSFASEIATMVVTEEVDALRMMAINPVRYVVAPKFTAITICMPLLVMLSIVVGILGGLIVAVTYLDLSMTAYFTELFTVLTTEDLAIGLSKSIFFAWVIVIIGAYYGFNVTGGSEGVGRATTKSVVAAIFAVIVLDALFSLIYMF